MRIRNLAALLVLLLLTGCTSHVSRWRADQDGPPNIAVDVSKIPNAVPRAEARSKYGNPAKYYVNGKCYRTLNSSYGYCERGIASWYGTKFHRKRTSSGEPYNLYAMTAAHRSLPLPTYARVTNLQNGRQIIVKINDRGPFKANRIIDLSYVAAKKLGISGTGLVEVSALNANTRPSLSSIFKPVTRRRSQPQIYMQVGSFSVLANAKQLAHKIGKITHHSTRIVTQNGMRHTIYRVQLGPLRNINESDQLNQKISHLGLGHPLTIID